MRSEVGDDRGRRRGNQRGVDLVAVRIEYPGAGKAVGVAALETLTPRSPPNVTRAVERLI
jgi:hypothetical protein